jgi:hypothetical protein
MNPELSAASYEGEVDDAKLLFDEIFSIINGIIIHIFVKN